MNQFEMKQLAYQSNLKNRALQVLLYLIDRANKEQTCFPAMPTIGRELHISISTVKRAMRELVEAGYVKKESRFREGNRGQTSIEPRPAKEAPSGPSPCGASSGKADRSSWRTSMAC